VTPEVEDRYFVGEAILIGAGLFLLNRYFGGLFKPVEEAGARHRASAVRLLKGLSKGSLSQCDDENARRLVQDTLTKARDAGSFMRR